MPLSVSDGLSAWIKDFMKSDAPQFKGKTKEEIVKMAIAAYTDAGGKLKEDKMKFKELREKYRSKFKSAEITKGVDIALSMGGNMTGAYKRIEAFKKGLSKDPMVQQALKLANESVNEGTMAIGIKDRDPKERAKAQAQLKVMLKKIGNKKVGSKEGQDFDDKLDYDILSDDELADEFANPKNKNMKVKDLLKKHSKRLGVDFS
jgi:hypothetical protein